MRTCVKKICLMLVAVLIVGLLAQTPVSAAETGQCFVMNQDCTIYYKDRTLAEAASVTYSTTNYWIELWSDVTTDGATFRGTNLTINLNTYKLTGNFTITNGMKLYYSDNSPGVHGTIYVTGGKVTVKEGMYVQDWELSGGTVNFEPAPEDLVAGYEAVDNGDGTWKIQEKPEITTVDITLKNKAEEAGAAVNPPASGWVEGTNTFTVSCAAPCVAAVSHDGGNTYTRLSATAAGENTFGFTAENMTADTILAVVLLGDVNGDGEITNADVTRLKAAYQSKVSLDALMQLAADVNESGDLSNADVTKLKAAYQNKTTLSW